MNECGRTLTDHTGTTVSCERRPGHRDDHGRGFLRWENSGYWYAVHSHPRWPGDIARPCPDCRDLVHDLPEHTLTCFERHHP